MLGWCSRAIASASRRKRVRASAPASAPPSPIFSATTRPRAAGRGHDGPPGGAFGIAAHRGGRYATPRRRPVRAAGARTLGPTVAENRPTSLTLLERARGRDADAWARLVGLYAPLVDAWCRHW